MGRDKFHVDGVGGKLEECDEDGMERRAEPEYLKGGGGRQSL